MNRAVGLRKFTYLPVDIDGLELGEDKRKCSSMTQSGNSETRKKITCAY